MPDNASLYLTDPSPIPHEYLQRLAPSAHVSFLPPGNGTAGGYMLATPAWRLVMNVLPPEQLAHHLGGFAGYVARITGGGTTPAAQATLQGLGATRLVLGCVVEPAFDPGGEMKRVLAAIASAARGLLFAHNAVYDAGGAMLVGPPGAPPSFLAAPATTGRTPAQRWILATGAILTQMNDGDPTLLGGWRRPAGTEHATACLRAYGIRTPSDAVERLEWLNAKGHRTEFAEKAGVDPRTYLAWDLGRFSSVAGWSYLAYLLDADTTWTWMTALARQIRGAFPGWQAFGDSYAAGRAMWLARAKDAAKNGSPGAYDAQGDDDEDDAGEVPRALATLLRRGGVWADLPWDLPLEGASVPLDPQRVLRVAPAAGGLPSLTAALAQAVDGDRIVVAPGTYREALTFDKSVEVAAEPGGPVIVEASGDRAIHVEDVGVSLEGLVLRATGVDEDGEGIDAVWAIDGYLRMRGCDVQAAGCGVNLCTENAEAALTKCAIHDCGGAGLLVAGGFLTAVEVELRANVLIGTQAAGEADAAFINCRVQGSKGPGIQIGEEAEVVVAGCDVSGNASNGVGVMDKGRLKLHDSRLHDGAGAGLVLTGESSAIVQRCEITNHAFSGIEVRETKELWMLACKVLGGAERGLWCHAEGAVRMEACEIRGSTGPCVVAESAEVIMNACTLAGSMDGSALWVTAGGRAKLAKCTIEGCSIAAIEVDGQGSFAEVTASTLKSGQAQGVHVTGNARFQIQHSLVTDFGSAGLQIDDGAEARIEGTRVQANRSMGIYVGEKARARLEECEVTENGGDGVQSSDGGEPHFVKCRVARNGEDDVFAYDAGRCVIEDSDVGGGQGHAVKAEGASQIVLRRTRVVPGGAGDVTHDATSRVVRE